MTVDGGLDASAHYYGMLVVGLSDDYTAVVVCVRDSMSAESACLGHGCMII